MELNLNFYRPPQPELWTGRVDGPNPERFHQRVTCIDLSGQDTNISGAVALVGFACDVGVRRNSGRPGAAEGPRALRQALGKLPVHQATPLIDVGDITCPNDDLETAQQILAQAIAALLQQKCFPIVLGGGHEVAWGHYLGIANSYPHDRIGIVNFDAHFDLRPLLEDDKGTSGTAFLQIAQQRQRQGLNFDYLCLGPQRVSNTSALYETANQLGVTVVPAEAIQYDSRGRVLAQIDQLLQRCDRIYVSVCMDVFAAAFAPGVSAPQALGLMPADVLPLLSYLANSQKVAGFDVAEVSPALDRDQLTSNLGAALIAHWLIKKC